MSNFNFKLVIFFWVLVSFSLVTSAQPSIKGKIKVDDANLRACAGINCTITKLLKKGDGCRVIHTEKLESIDGYGTNTWAEIQVNNSRGFVYGALIEIIPNKEGLITLNKRAKINTNNTNVRICPLRKCDILFQIPKGSFCYVIGKTKTTTKLPNTHQAYPWYLITFNGKTGFVYGSLLEFDVEPIINSADDNDISSGEMIQIDSLEVDLFNEQKQKIGIIQNGGSYPLLEVSKKSELRRPFGRYYWYKIELVSGQTGWVFGAFTSKINTPVDCQCVDFVKHKFKITGPTKNAFEWDEVLLGQIDLTIDGKPNRLSAEEIFDFSKVKKGDIAIFDNEHPEAHPDYGHIGFVVGKKTRSNGATPQILIEGGNHKVSKKSYYTANRCNNISKKFYTLNTKVRFFRL